MPKIKAVSFDCAGTLLDVRWSPGPFALTCAERVGLNVDGQIAQEVYERILRSRWPDYMAANRTKDIDLCLEWWRDLTRSWLEHLGLDHSLTEPLMTVSEELLYDADGPYFRPFDDAVRALEAVSKLGLPIIVISNWDYSLHRILRVQGISHYFKHVFASLEEGVEKPDPKLFQIALQALGLEPHEVLHVGDHPSDDYSGATAAGLSALLVDRAASVSSGYVIKNLDEVVGYL